jgi:hypothetical protein
MNVTYYDDQQKKIFCQSLYEESSTQKEVLGTVMTLANGDEFVYCQAGAVALAPGKLVQSIAVDETAFANLAVDTVALGSNVFSVTMGTGGDVTANQLKDGYLHVNDDTGEGHIYRIHSNTAAAAAAASSVTIYGANLLALGANATVTVTQSKYKGVIVHPSPPTTALVGVPLFAITASYYFWAKKRGYATVLADGALVAGKMVTASDATDGAVEVVQTSLSGGAVTLTMLQPVGVCVTINATTEYALIDLRL